MPVCLSADELLPPPFTAPATAQSSACGSQFQLLLVEGADLCILIPAYMQAGCNDACRTACHVRPSSEFLRAAPFEPLALLLPAFAFMSSRCPHRVPLAMSPKELIAFCASAFCAYGDQNSCIRATEIRTYLQR